MANFPENYREVSHLEAARSPQGNQGASLLGYALGGGGEARREQMYNQGALSGARLADVLSQARQRQQAEVGRQANYHAALDRGDNDMANMFLYSTPNEVADYEGKHQKTGYTKQVWDAQNAGTQDDAKRNALLAIIHGEPSTSFDIKEGLGFNPHGNPDQTPSVTPVGTASIAEKNALAGEHNAQAARANAGIGADKAANWELQPTANGIVRVNKLTGETQPLTMGGNNVVKAPASPKAFTEHEMAAALPSPDNLGKIDPLRFRQFESTKNANPGLGDSDVYAKMRQEVDDDPAAAASLNIGPPANLAGSGDSIMSRLFGSGAPATPAAQPMPPRKIVRTGKAADGSAVVQYDDGTIGPAP